MGKIYANGVDFSSPVIVNDTYQEKLGIGTFTGSIDGLGDGGLPYTSSICWCDSSKVSGSLPYYGSTKYWFVLETNEAIDNQKSSIRSQKATIWLQDGNRVFERIFTNGEWYAWKEYLPVDGDLKDTTVSFTSGDDLNPTGWTAIGKIFSGVRLKDILNGFSTGIKNLRFLYKLIGTTDISKIGDGTLTGLVSALNTDIQVVNGYITTARGGVSASGWYRIAEVSSSDYNSCIISLKRGYSLPAPEYQRVQFLSTYSKKKFVSISALSDAHMWTKIRATRENRNSPTYIEIYQNRNSNSNVWLISIEDAIGAYGTEFWKAMVPTLVQETATDATVLASLDLPADNPA